MSSCIKLREVFKNDYDFAWRLLQAECQINTKREITIQDITILSELYMKAVEKLNTIQDSRQKYFTKKMQQFMAKPYVIRCFNSESDGKKNQMQFKRREIQQIVLHQNQRANTDRLNHMINQYGQKQKKYKQKVDKIMKQHQKNLQLRLKKRASIKPDRLSYLESFSLESSSNQKSQNQWKSNSKNFNPESYRKVTTSQFIQFDSP